MRISKKVAIVTGSTSGIGKAIAEQFLQEGAYVVFSGRTELFDSSSFGDNACYIPCDVSDSKQVDNLVAKTIERFGRLDIMVNNAGIFKGVSILDTTDETWNETTSINLSGVMYGVRAAARAMKELGIKGSIINTSSILGNVGMANALDYTTSKGGISLLTKASALDLAPLGIRVNSIAPGFIATDMTKDVQENPDLKKWVIEKTPLKFMGEPNDIAFGAVYLASDESRFVTGTTLFIDGGWTAE